MNLLEFAFSNNKAAEIRVWFNCTKTYQSAKSLDFQWQCNFSQSECIQNISASTWESFYSKWTMKFTIMVFAPEPPVRTRHAWQTGTRPCPGDFWHMHWLWTVRASQSVADREYSNLDIWLMQLHCFLSLSYGCKRSQGFRREHASKRNLETSKSFSIFQTLWWHHQVTIATLINLNIICHVLLLLSLCQISWL